MLSEEQQRKDFEAWYVPNYTSYLPMHEGQYSNLDTALAFESFKAGRAIEQAAIAEQVAPAGDDVVWKYELAESINRQGEYCNWTLHYSDEKPMVPEKSIRNLTSYTPQPAECKRCAELESERSFANAVKNKREAENYALHREVAEITADKARAEAVIEKVDQFIQSPISLKSCTEMNKAIDEYRDYSIAYYQKGVES